MQHRVGQQIMPPRSSDLKPEQRVVLHIFNVQNISNMKQTKEEKREMKMAQLRAAHMLMTEFVKRRTQTTSPRLSEN